MATLGADDYSRLNQSGWGTASDGTNVWVLDLGNSSFSISSNQGAVSGHSNAFCNMQCGTTTAADTIQLVAFTRANTADVAGAFCRYTNANNWYSINLGEFTNNLTFSKMVGGVFSDVAFGPHITPTIADSYSIRFSVIGSTIKARCWDATAGSEPSTWDINVTDTSLSSAGNFGVIADPFSATPMVFTSYLATDANGPTLPGTTVHIAAPMRFVLTKFVAQTAPLRFVLSTAGLVIPWDGQGLSTSVPIPLPKISLNLPAYTNDNFGGSYPASRADDSDYTTLWRCSSTPTSGAPVYLALDLSSVPTAQRRQVIVHLLNDPATGAWNPQLISVNSYNIPKTYTLQGNVAAGGSYPSSGWVTLLTEADNPYHSRLYQLNLTGYNWFQVNITDIYGSTLNENVQLNLDIYDASKGFQDTWAIAGDSITQQGALHDNTGGGTFAQLVNAQSPSFFPAFDSWGIGGFTSSNALTYFATWLTLTPARYITLNYGTNDANLGGTGFDTTFKGNMIAMIEQILAAEKIPVIPLIPWGRTPNLLANVPTLNAIIQNLYLTYPQIIPGPDFYSYYLANQPLINTTDNIHPTLIDGYAAWRQLYVNAMLTRVYTPKASLVAPAVAPPLTLPNASGYLGQGPVVPLYQQVGTYLVNGTPLATSPTIATTPRRAGRILPIGTSFTLGFQNPDSGTTTVFASGGQVTLTFTLENGKTAEALVQVMSMTSGSYFQVDCVLVEAIET